MIIIKKKGLKTIVNDYTAQILSAITNRIEILTKLVSILRSNSNLNDEKIEYQSFNKAIKVLLNNDERGGANKTDLIDSLDIIRKELNRHEQRIDIVENSLKVLTNSLLVSIISNKPKQLLEIQTITTNKLKCDKDDVLISYLFSYDSFYDGIIKKIGASLGISVCPYCNRQYITDIQNIDSKRIIGPTYDHFFDKKRNAILALSFYNLIPSCFTCNSNLKGSKEFNLETNLHPYLHEMGDSAKFDFELDTSKIMDKRKINFKPELNVLVNANTIEYKRLVRTPGNENSGNIDVFKLREIYATHSDFVEEIHEKFDANSTFYANSIKSLLTKLSSNEAEFYRYYFGNYYNPIDFNKRPLAKLTRDIYDKMLKVRQANKSYKTK